MHSDQSCQSNACTDHISISLLFANPLDHHQFEQLFQAIDCSPLVQSLKITHFLSKEIAEWSTGSFKTCASGYCGDEIHVLFEDQQIYSNDHKNAAKVGYKWCKESDRYFCSDCMETAHSCECECCDALCLLSDCDQCHACHSFICDCVCKCDCNFSGKCTNCAGIFCSECYDLEACAECSDLFCAQCRITPYSDVLEFNVCHKCYDDRIIECQTCDAKYPILFSSNTELYAMDGSELNMIAKCKYKFCDIFICQRCDPKAKGAQRVQCREDACDVWTGFVCKKHIGMVTYVCCDHA